MEMANINRLRQMVLIFIMNLRIWNFQQTTEQQVRRWRKINGKFMKSSRFEVASEAGGRRTRAASAPHRTRSRLGELWFQLLFDVVISLVFIRAAFRRFFTSPFHPQYLFSRAGGAPQPRKLICLALRLRCLYNATRSRIELSGFISRTSIAFVVHVSFRLNLFICELMYKWWCTATSSNYYYTARLATLL